MRRLASLRLSREIIAAGDQHMLKSLSHRVGVDNRCIGSVRVGVIFIQETVQFARPSSQG